MKLRDRAAPSDGAERIRFTSAILPRWARRHEEPGRTVAGALPARASRWATSRRRWRHCLGKDAPNLSPAVISQTDGASGRAEYERWQKRDLSARRYVYVLGGRRLPAGSHERAETADLLPPGYD